MKLFLVFSILTASNYAEGSCLGLNEVCNDDCDCCGHPNNKAIRCEKRIPGDSKRCHEARTIFGPCLDNSQCLSQNCVDGVCLPPLRGKRPSIQVGLCSMGNSDDIEALNGNLPGCACDKPAADSLASAMDGDLSTDYTNFHSKDGSGLILEPSFKAPLREMEVCTSNQDMANDPMCYSIYGECKDEEGVYNLLHHGMLELPSTRKECTKVGISGRQSYSKYKVEFGCRREEYNEICPVDPFLCSDMKASCREVTPKGKDRTCTPFNSRNGANSLSDLFLDSINYDETEDLTSITYSFLNKMGNGQRVPDLAHAIIQYVGACCVSTIRVYTAENGIETTYYTNDSAGDHVQSPKPTVCMAGVHLPGVKGANKFYFELHIEGYFPNTATVDYVVRAGDLVKYGQVQGPDCRCTVRRGLAEKRAFRGLPSDVTPRKRRLACVDKPVSISEVKLHGKCNEG